MLASWRRIRTSELGKGKFIRLDQVLLPQRSEDASCHSFSCGQSDPSSLTYILSSRSKNIRRHVLIVNCAANTETDQTPKTQGQSTETMAVWNGCSFHCNVGARRLPSRAALLQHGRLFRVQM